jgi:3-hydroxyisobutyrate dehydrogenase
MADQDTIAVLGAGGTMGLPIARNLANAGLAIRVWNRTPEKAKALSDHGADVVETPAAAAEGADVILTIVSDTDAVLDCMDGEAGALSAERAGDALWLQMSTIGEEGTERCTELAREHGLEFVDAPVLGTKAPAESGELIILASGPQHLHDRLRPIFDAVGARTMWVGEAGTGTRLKLAINTWVLAVVEGGAETVALAEGLGLDPQLVFDAIAGGPLDLPYLRVKGKAMMERNFDPSFRLALAAKDAGLVEDAMRRRNLDLPLIRTIRARLDEGASEHPDHDMSATYLTSAPSS